jgi:mono/diheme cytochrome c family protein
MITRKTAFLGIAGLFLGALLIGHGTVIAQTKDKTLKSVPAPYSDPTSGKVMFKDYCAACHGMDGKGNGPAVEYLKTPPADLTTLAKRNQGKFPSRDFNGILNFGTSSHAHGTADMPLWGDLFRSRAGRGLAGMRIANLNSYVESMQEK